MRLLIIFGPPAVGKKTVGAAIAERTAFKLFHNHMSLDPVEAVFEWGSPPFQRLVSEIRLRFMEEAAAAGIDLIFTYVWALEDPRDQDVIDSYRAVVAGVGGETLFVELVADQEARQRRNVSPKRLARQRMSGEAATAEWIAEMDRNHRFQSDGDFPYPEQHLRLDTTDLAPADAAERVIAHFALERRAR